LDSGRDSEGTELQHKVRNVVPSGWVQSEAHRRDSSAGRRARLREGWMLVLLRIGAASVILVSVLGGWACRAGIPRLTPVDVCSVVAHPGEYSGKPIVVRGLLDFVISQAAPPPILAGNCPHGIALILHGSAPGSEDLFNAEIEPRPSSSAARRIWVTVRGSLQGSGNRMFFAVDAVKDIVVRPNLAVREAEVPKFPDRATAARATVRISVTILDGKVVHTQILGEPDRIFARAALENVRTWRFDSQVDAQITTVFSYRVATRRGCPPSNPQIVLNLPRSVVLTRWRRLPCNPPAGGATPFRQAALRGRRELGEFVNALKTDDTLIVSKRGRLSRCETSWAKPGRADCGGPRSSRGLRGIDPRNVNR